MTAPERATMRDVAELAGVSIKTVSRVLNNERHVSPQRTDRVVNAAQALNYKLNTYAGSLRRAGARTKTVGLMVASVDNPFSGAIHRGVENVLAARGVAVFTASSDEDPNRERTILNEFLQRRVDGLILTPTSSDHSHLANEIPPETPTVFVDRPAVEVNADSVLSTNYQGAFSAAEHLILHGHRRIGFIGDDASISTTQERYRGFRDALRIHRISEAESLCAFGARSESQAVLITRQLLTGHPKPTAFFAAQNLILMGVLRSLRETGAHRQIAHVGFDDIDLADLLDPAVTVVAQDPIQMGELAASRLLHRISNYTGSATKTFLVPTRLIARGSGEIGLNCVSNDNKLND